MKQTVTLKIAFLGFISMCIATVFFAIPQYSSAKETEMYQMGDTRATSSKTGLHDRMEHASSSRGKNVDATCMQTTMDTREDALVSAWGVFNGTITTGLSARKSAIYTAWGLTDLKERNDALIKSWKDWKKTSKDAHSGLRGAKKSAWETFKKTAKDSCKVTAPKDEALGKDSSGEIAL
jgi:hypothetical protein